jgi:hypothetical protein|tara:strand:- start:195 stop:860 length:666 start_codon:yes stop_codon:yes gene_type:complete
MLKCKNLIIPILLFILVPLVNAQEPIVTLVSPDNNTITNESLQTFECSATDDIELSNISFFHNSTGTFTINDTSFASSTSQTSFFNESFDFNATIAWNCQAIDTSANEDFAVNRTITFNQTFITITSASPPFFTVSTCQSSTAGFIGLGLIMLIAIIFIIIGLATKIGFIGFFGAIIMFLGSLFFIPCSNILGETLVFLSIMLLIYFAVRGFLFPSLYDKR